MGEDSRVIKRVSSGFRERLRQKPDTREMQRDPSRASGLQRCPRANQPADVSQVVSHLLDEFHLLIQEMVLQKSQK